jgi:fatty acid desaturase
MNQPHLPLAILGERSDLSAEAQAEIRTLTGPNPRYFLLQLTLAWGLIAAAIAWAESAQSFWATLLAVIVIATRQNVLALLVHEQAHCLGFKPRFGDGFVNLFVAYPLMITTVEDYTRVHLTHHKYFFQDNDPDFIRKSGPDWVIPMTPGQLVRLLLTDIIGLNVIQLIRGKRMASGGAEFRRRSHTVLRAAFFIGAATLLTLTGAWQGFLLYWLLPLMTITQVLIRWGALTEHEYNLPGATVAEATPVVIPSLLDRIIMPNMNFSMHVYHHYFSGVSAQHLRRVHEIFVREGLVNGAHIFRGYGAYLRFLLSGRSSPAVATGTAVQGG